MKTVMVGNHKGGVGKTTTTYTLGCIAARAGHRVLMCDLDAQGSLTAICIGQRSTPRGLADVLGGTQRALGMSQAITRGKKGEPDLASGGPALVNTEVSLMTRLNREQVLKQALASVSRQYDLVLLDTSAAASLLTTNALTAADGVIIPCQTQSLDVDGLRAFADSIEMVRAAVNRKLTVLGVVATFHAPRQNENKRAIEDIIKTGLPLCRTFIGRSVRVGEAARANKDIIRHAADNAQARAYHELAVELGIIQKERARAC